MMNFEDGDDKKSSENKICSVCGDAALGYNFNAVSCESCKAFFRRNALKTKETRCPFENDCVITAVTRRFCQKCRLAKCYRVGMKRELIMSEADKERKRKKIMDNRTKLQNKINSVCAQGTTVSSSQTFDISHCKSIQTDSSTTVDCAIQTDPSLLSSCRCFLQPQSCAETSSTAHRTPSYLPSITEDEACFSLLGLPQTSCTSLTPSHKALLDDLVMASNALDAPLDEELANLPGEEFKQSGSGSLLDIINLTALAIKRLIKMCKRINSFKALPQEDQVSLLKQGCTRMMILRSVVTFDPDKNSWKIPHTVEQLSQIHVEVLKEAPGNLYEAHENFLRTFDPRASRDINVMCILTTIALFDPSRPPPSNRHFILRHQEMYYELLLRYLESVYSYNEAHKIYSHLIYKMNELKRLNEDHVRVYLEVNPSQVEPILIEIFDLKPH